MKILKQILLIVVFLVATTSTVSALSIVEPVESVLKAFKNFKIVETPEISVPTVIEVPMKSSELERNQFAVLDAEENKFLPYYFEREYKTAKTPYSLRTLNSTGPVHYMLDGNLRTFTEFDLAADERVSETTIYLDANSAITSSSLTLQLDNYVALPTMIEIQTSDNGRTKVVVAKKSFSRKTISFPKTTAKSWVIKLTYIQPLRISEVQLRQDNVEATVAQGVRFLAQPSGNYVVYYNPDRSPNVNVGESGNLRSDDEVMLLNYTQGIVNPTYTESDNDGDGIPDLRDNCVSVSNADQLDVNKNGRGDACDDFDRDGRINSRDNCPDNPNVGQRDEDGDGIGDVCDGEESRFTEKHAWVPWAGMGIAVIVILGLFIFTLTSMKRENGVKEEESTPAEGGGVEPNENIVDTPSEDTGGGGM